MSIKVVGIDIAKKSLLLSVYPAQQIGRSTHGLQRNRLQLIHWKSALDSSPLLKGGG